MLPVHCKQLLKIGEQPFRQLGRMTMIAKMGEDFSLAGHMAFAVTDVPLGHL